MAKLQDDPGAMLVLWIVGALMLIPVIIFAGIFIFIPLAVIWVAVLVIRYLNRPPPPPSTAHLHEQTQVLLFPDNEVFAKDLFDAFFKLTPNGVPNYEIFIQLVHVTRELYNRECFTVPPLQHTFAGTMEEARYRDFLLEHTRKTRDPQQTLQLFKGALCTSYLDFMRHLPHHLITQDLDPDAPPASFNVPLKDVLPNVGKVISDTVLPFFDAPLRELGLFKDLRRTLEERQAAASPTKNLVMPEDYKGGNVVETYLRGTVIEELFETEVPFEIDEQRFSGHWIIAPPGRGKTTLLHSMLAEDFKRDASIIVMDSKGDLIDPIRNLKEFEDRYIIIDPDPQNPIAINPLDIPKANITHAVDLLEYLFGSLLEFKMTALQTTLFRSVLRALVTVFPNPTLETFRDILTNGYEKYEDYIKKLPQDLQDFFYKEFNDRLYADRRREVAQRLRLLLDNETLRSMLLAMRTRFDMGAAMDAGKVIIINNSKALLGDTGSEFFGRFFIAQVLAAAQQRSGRKGPKKPVYFYIDECQNVIARDDKISTILDECRSQRIALIMAHQRTSQIASANVLDALSNCAVRYANSDDEARYLAPRLRTTERFLQSLGRGHFAAFVRDMTPKALDITVTPVVFGAKLSAEEQLRLKERTRDEYGVPAILPAPELDPGAKAPGERVADQLGAVAEEIIDVDKLRKPPVRDRTVAAKVSQPTPHTNSEGATDWR
jgi:hypothetical protein